MKTKIYKFNGKKYKIALIKDHEPMTLVTPIISITGEPDQQIMFKTKFGKIRGSRFKKAFEIV